MKLYVAYGSNLNMEQMARRCPKAKVFAKGELRDWELLFRGRPGSAYATIRRKIGSTVPVLLWKITEYDEGRLDSYEGYPSHYFKETVTVNIGEAKVRAMVYLMAKRRLTVNRPSAVYVDTIRKGYEDCGFDYDVLAEMLAVNEQECCEIA